jgi:PKHD-type hydroxylase
VLLKIRNLLTPQEITRLTGLSRELRFVEGRASNPANETKNNLQADTSDPKHAEAVQVVSTAFARSREFMEFALPKRVAPPLLSRYAPGMKYGAHADAALIPLASSRLRSDVSCTVFINDPASYEGGELSIVIGNQAIAFKGAPGEAFGGRQAECRTHPPDRRRPAHWHSAVRPCVTRSGSYRLWSV